MRATECFLLLVQLPFCVLLDHWDVWEVECDYRMIHYV